MKFDSSCLAALFLLASSANGFSPNHKSARTVPTSLDASKQPFDFVGPALAFAVAVGSVSGPAFAKPDTLPLTTQIVESRTAESRELPTPLLSSQYLIGASSFDTLDFSLPSYTEGVTAATKAPPSFSNPFEEGSPEVDKKQEQEDAKKAAAEARKEAAEAKKAAAEAKKTAEKEAAEQRKLEQEKKKEALEARKAAEKEKQRLAVERASKRAEEEKAAAQEETSAPAVEEAKDETPSFSAPSFSAPDVSLPEMSLPDVKLPSFGKPDIKMPSFQKPDVKLPSFDKPDIKLPSFEKPDVKLPSFEKPDIKVPDVKIPKFDAPDVKVPSFSAPDVKIPSFSAPDIKMPATPSFSFGGDDSSSIDIPEGESQESRDARARDANVVFKRLDADAKVRLTIEIDDATKPYYSFLLLHTGNRKES